MESYQEIGGHRLRVVEEGRGPPIVFFYDAWHTAIAGEPLGAELTPRFRTVSFDLPGFGLTPLPEDYSFKFDDYAKLLGKFLEQYGLGPLTLVLSDLGSALGMIALGENEKLLDHVGHVVLLNGMLYGDDGARGPLKRSAFFTRWDLPLNRMGHRRRVLGLCGAPESFDESVAQLAWEPFHRGTYNAQFHLIGEINQSTDLLQKGRETLAASGVPLLVLWGENDPSGGKAVAERIGKDFPEAEIYLLPEVGHFPHIEATEVVAEAVEGFVKKRRRQIVTILSKTGEESPAPD